ncbi:MAG: TOBE domain-containing protein, partial [Acidimicrobiia bacterium]
ARLSGGERQRVALARTLAGDQPVVALDEPLAPIDHRDRSVVAAVIRNATASRALLCVTHSIEGAAAIADELILMDDGQIVQRGLVHDVLALPADERAAELVGVSNVVAASVVDRTGDFAVVDLAGESLVVMAGAAVGAEVVLRIPAESIAVLTEAPHGSSYRNVVEGSVEAMLPRGALVEVALVGAPGLVALVTPGAADALELEPGSHVWFGVKTAAISVIAER